MKSPIIETCPHFRGKKVYLRHTKVSLIGASVSEPPLSAANGDFVGAYVRMHGSIYRKYFKYLFQRHALAHARPTMLCIH